MNGRLSGILIIFFISVLFVAHAGQFTVEMSLSLIQKSRPRLRRINHQTVMSGSNYYGPLAYSEWDQNKEWNNKYFLYPFSYRSKKKDHSFSWTAPLFLSSKMEGTESRFQCFPFYYHFFKNNEDALERQKQYLFPLCYVKRKGVLATLFERKSEVSYLFPFYFSSRMNSDNYSKAWLANAFVLDARDGNRRASLLYPFFSLGYDGYHYARIFPLFIYRNMPKNQYFSFLYPFYIQAKTPALSGRSLFPIYFDYSGPTRNFQSYAIFYLRDHKSGGFKREFNFFPFWGRDIYHDYQVRHFIWPLGKSYRNEQRARTRFIPLFDIDHQIKAEQKSWSFLSKCFYHKRTPSRIFGNFTPLIHYKKDLQTNSSRWKMLPLFDYHRQPDSLSFRLLGPLFPSEPEGYRQTWGRYFRLFAYKRKGNDYENDCLFRIFTWGRKQKEKHFGIHLLLLQLEWSWTH